MNYERIGKNLKYQKIFIQQQAFTNRSVKYTTCSTPLRSHRKPCGDSRKKDLK
jgi:hypothetical protein